MTGLTAAQSLAAKLEALDLTDDERALLDAALARAIETADDEVGGFAKMKYGDIFSLSGPRTLYERGDWDSFVGQDTGDPEDTRYGG